MISDNNLLKQMGTGDLSACDELFAHQEAGSVGGWLIQTATNRALNLLRSLKRKRTQPFEPVLNMEEKNDDESVPPPWMIDQASFEKLLAIFRREDEAPLW